MVRVTVDNASFPAARKTTYQTLVAISKDLIEDGVRIARATA